MIFQTVALTLAFALFSTFGLQVEAFAQSSVTEANKGRIGIMTGSASGTYIKVGGDLTKVMDGKRGLRIVPMVGKGSQQNVNDLLYFRQTDAAIVQADVLELIRRDNSKKIEQERLAYIARIYDEEIHVVARTSSDIRTIGDLDGKRVNIGGPGSGSQMTSNILLSFFDLRVQLSELSNSDALEGIIKGDLDAMIFVQKKPSSLLKGVSDPSKIAILPLEITEPMKVIYTAASFSSEDYPNLIAGREIDTIAVPAVLAVYDNFARNGSRYLNLEKFSHELVSVMDTLKSKYPARWRDTDIRTEVPGWKRFEPMDDALNNRGIRKRKTLFD